MFFFQAEDGIRDHCVTGVQTCALPICCSSQLEAAMNNDPNSLNDPTVMDACAQHATPMQWEHAQDFNRSEERRVGKECRYRRSPVHERQKSPKIDGTTGEACTLHSPKR